MTVSNPFHPYCNIWPCRRIALLSCLIHDTLEDWSISVLCCFSQVPLFATLWTVVCQAPLSMGCPRQEILEWVAIPFSRGSSPLRIKHKSPAVQENSLPSEPPGKPWMRKARYKRINNSVSARKEQSRTMSTDSLARSPYSAYYTSPPFFLRRRVPDG